MAVCMNGRVTGGLVVNGLFNGWLGVWMNGLRD